MTAEEIAIKHGLYHSHTKQADDKAVAAMNEHTAAHTAGLEAKYNEAYSSAAKYAEESVRLRERVKELETRIEETLNILTSQAFNEYKVRNAIEELENALKE